MKKWMSMLILFATLLSLCACGADSGSQATTAATEPTEITQEATEPTEQTAPGMQALTPEQMFGHINQLEPVDGVYKIWNAEGVKNIGNHPEADFELLCNVDMGGAAIAPIGTAEKPFTGELKGANFFITNFTVQGGEETDFGFIGVNKGTVRNLVLEQVTFLPGKNAKNIGALAGLNEGTINRCNVTGTMTVETAAEGAACGAVAGVTSGTVSNTIATVDIAYNASAAATVGGIAGIVNGGTVEFTDTNGKLDVAGSNKQTGLLVGAAKDATLQTLAFVGASNTLDGKLFDNYFGAQENCTAATLLRRDNSREPEKPHIQEKRQKVVDYMNAMASVEWKVKEDFAHNCTCSLGVCHGTFSARYTYYGPPYNHKASSLYRMQYCIDENGYIKDFVTDLGGMDGYDIYIGSDCSSATLQAFLTVGTEVYFTQTQDEVPTYGHGTYPVGEYVYDLDLDPTSQAMITKKYTEHNGPEVMYAAYAQVRMGDAVVYWYDGAGHSRLCVSDAVVVRDENGNINPVYSYILMSEQGVVNYDDVALTYTSWNIGKKYTFDNLYGHYYLPITIKEFMTGEFETPECTLEGGLTDSRAGLTAGTIVSNYSLDYVTMVITDETGETVFEHIMFPSVSRAFVDGGTHSRTRAPQKSFDLISFGPALQEVPFQLGGTYHATITATQMCGESFVVSDFSFQNGNAQ